MVGLRLRHKLLGAMAGLALLAGCAAPMREAHVPAPDARGFLQTVASVSSSMIARGQTTGFWFRPAQIFAARLAAVRKAKQSIRFETYYMTPGRRANDFAKALIERKQAGVSVSFLADADGTKYLPVGYWDQLRAHGIEVRFYHPLEATRPWEYNARTHRKLLLIDGQVAFTGGAGVSDEWDGGGASHSLAPWADVEVRLEGPVVTVLEGAFVQHWTYLGGEADLGSLDFKLAPDRGRRLLVTASSPNDGGSQMRTLYHTLLLSARKRIWIASPYFLPSPTDQAELIRAHRRGIDVRILSVGPKNDQGYTYNAVREHAIPMVKAGVPILEYQPAMMHAKSLLIDDRWVVIGSANFDPRSFYQNEELAVASDEPVLATETRAFFEEAFLHTRRLSMAQLAARDPLASSEGKALLLIWWFL